MDGRKSGSGTGLILLVIGVVLIGALIAFGMSRRHSAALRAEAAAVAAVKRSILARAEAMKRQQARAAAIPSGTIQVALDAHSDADLAKVLFELQHADERSGTGDDDLVRNVRRALAAIRPSATGIYDALRKAVLFNDVRPGAYRVHATGPSIASAWSPIIRVSESAGASATMALARPLPIGGVVTDEKGHAITNATVTVLAGTDPWTFGGDWTKETAAVGSNGAFAISAPEASARTLIIQAPGFGTFVSCDVRPGDPPRIHRMHRAGSLRGKVIDRVTGRPIARVMIAVFCAPPQAPMPAGASSEVAAAGSLGAAESDDSGDFQIDGLDLSSPSLAVAADGGEYVLAGGAPFRPIAAPYDRMLTIEMEKGAAVTGRVCDRATKAPIAGALVFALRGRPTGTGAAVPTNDAGEFTLSGLSPVESLTIVVNADDRTTVRLPFAPRLGAGERRSIPDIEVEAGVSVTGRVLETDGTPVSGATVAWFPGDASRPAILVSARAQEARRTVTGADGRFAFSDVDRDGVTLFVRTEDRPYAARFAVDPMRGKEEELRLPAMHVIHGRVTDHLGAPVAGLTFSARWHWPGPVDPELGEPITRHRSDAEGRVDFAGITTDTFEMTVFAPGKLDCSSNLEAVIVALARRDGQDLMIGLNLTGVIEGTVTDEKGAPAADAVVSVLVSEAEAAGADVLPIAATRTDERGRFVIRGLVRKGGYRVRAGAITFESDGTARIMRTPQAIACRAVEGDLLIRLAPADR